MELFTELLKREGIIRDRIIRVNQASSQGAAVHPEKNVA
jgi:hypothetical protein